MKETITPMAREVREFKVRLARKALELTDGKKNEAAKLLGIARKTLWEILRSAKP